MVNATGLQKNTSAAVQSRKHGGDFARCNNQACKHGVGVQNAHGMLDNVGTQDSGVLTKCHNVLIGR